MADRTTEYTELDALLRAGILTADEHAQARRKLSNRSYHSDPHGRGGHGHVVHGNGNGNAVRQPQRSNGGRTPAGATTIQRREPVPDARFARVPAVPARVAEPRQPVRPPRPSMPPNGAPPNGAPPNGVPHRSAVTQPAPEPVRTSVATLPTRDPQAAERPRPPGARGRHAKQSAPQWPWVLIGLFALVSVAVLAVALSHHSHHKARAGGPATHAVSRPTNQAPPPNVIAGSKVEVPESINVNGADATVTVSKLTALPAAANSPTVTYQTTVSALGVYGTFPLDKANFTAQSQTGASYHALAGSATPLAKTTVTAGQRVAGTIQFTLLRGQTVQTVLFTTSLGEQLGIWTTY
jgi:uncharacterized protein DUF1942